MAILVDLQRVTARLAERTLFTDVSLTVSSGDRIGVVGVNGTGKSTLLGVVAGAITPDSGSVLRGRQTRVGYLAQEPALAPGSVRNTVGTGWQADELLSRVGLDGHADRDAGELSGGQAKRVALASVLAQQADLLVLDEPTNHLDLAAVNWLEGRLRAFRGGLVLVSHDRHLLDRVVDRIVELDRGSAFSHAGGYGDYLDAQSTREELAVANEATRANLARRELAWLRRGAPARTRKPQARIDAARALVNQRMPAPSRASELELSFGTPRLGDRVITVDAVTYHFEGGSAPTLRDISVDLDPRDRLGIVGPNGSGKSTLLDLFAGRKQPTEGVIEVGSTVCIGYYDQRGVDLDPRARVRDLVAGDRRAPGSPQDNALMERFWFTKDLPYAPVSTLSGGERRRLQLLLVLARRPNVLLLDEPTNDLDLDTLRMIEEFLDDWPGAVVVASHDRTFLQRTTERLVSVEADGRIAPVVGGLEAYLGRLSAPSAPLRAKGALKADQRSVAGASAEGKRRSASTLGHLLREAERNISSLSRERDRLGSLMEATTDYVELARLGSSLAQVERRLAEAEHTWLELAEEADS